MIENSELKIHYLDMIQDVIKRMQNNSFILKGWAVSLIAGIFALISKEARISCFATAYMPVLLFWILDSYYLQLERKYRVLYKAAIKKNSLEIDFNLDAPKARWEDKTTYLQSLISKTEVIFYLSSGLLAAIVIIILNR